MSRCLYNSSFEEFISADENLIFGVIDGGAHGVTLTTAKEAWKAEISIMKDVISSLKPKSPFSFSITLYIILLKPKSFSHKISPLTQCF